MVFITKVFLPVAIFLFFRIINSNFRRLTRNVFIIGDSMIKKVDGYLLTNSIKQISSKSKTILSSKNCAHV